MCKYTIYLLVEQKISSFCWRVSVVGFSLSVFRCPFSVVSFPLSVFSLSDLSDLSDRSDNFQLPYDDRQLITANLQLATENLQLKGRIEIGEQGVPGVFLGEDGVLQGNAPVDAE